MPVTEQIPERDIEAEAGMSLPDNQPSRQRRPHGNRRLSRELRDLEVENALLRELLQDIPYGHPQDIAERK